MLWDVAVIGGGMSGLVSAIEVKRNYPEKSVVIFEQLEKVGKKILATGNGRCNLDNMTAKESDYNNSSFVAFALDKFHFRSNETFWESMGLLTYSDIEGRTYPRSNSATSVLDVLRFEIEKLGIEVVFEKVEKLKKEKNFQINNYQAKNVIMCCGGCSSPSQGSDGSGFELLKKMGHTITRLSPSLVQITTDTKFVKPLKGVRVKGRLTLEENDKLLGISDGEILFADYGLSGIATMDLSRYLVKIRNLNGAGIYLDMVSYMKQEEIVSYFTERQKSNPLLQCDNLLTGFLPKAVGKVILKKLTIFPGEQIKNLTRKDFEKIAQTIKRFDFRVTGTKGFQFSQVTSGGVSLDEVDSETLMSKKVKGLYFAGEILDVDSRCGGFNLRWAVSSARLAAELKG